MENLRQSRWCRRCCSANSDTLCSWWICVESILYTTCRSIECKLRIFCHFSEFDYKFSKPIYLIIFGISQYFRIFFLKKKYKKCHGFSFSLQTKLYKEECGWDNPLRCYVGDVSFRTDTIGEIPSFCHTSVSPIINFHRNFHSV